jgi:hypothetical protein
VGVALNYTNPYSSKNGNDRVGVGESSKNSYVQNLNGKDLKNLNGRK